MKNKKCAPGVRELLKSNEVPQYKPITKEEFEKNISEWLEEMKEDRRKRGEEKPKIVLFQGCLTYGYANRSSVDLDLCGNPECPSCNMLNDLLKEEAKNIFKNGK